MPSRRVSSSTSARASSPRSAFPFQSWNSSCAGIRETLRRLEQQRDALAASDAGGADPAPRPPAPHLVQEMRGDAGAGSRQRMADRDGPAVDVGAVAGQAEILLHREILRGERLVDLEQIEVRE